MIHGINNSLTSGKKNLPTWAKLVVAGGVVHPWVGQIVLKCNVFKTIFVRPTDTLDEGHEAACRGHGRPWLAVLKHGGTLAPCFNAELQRRRRARRPEKLSSSD